MASMPRALGASASVRGVLESDDRALDVPFWALPADEILWFYVGAVGGTLAQRFAELIADSRRTFAAECEWLDLDPAAITADTPRTV